MLSEYPGSVLAELSRNKLVIASASAWAIAQTIKVILGVIRERRFNFKWFVGSGGMPSSHAALAACLCSSSGFYYGFDSGLFAMTLGFAVITMFDAQGVRRQSGHQAEALNKILEDVYAQKGLQEERLKELFGHTPVEVFCGGLLGIVIAILFYKP
jgi:acid phosphatase family membrane protein YuiD